MDEILDRVIAEEENEMNLLDQYTPIIETKIWKVRRHWRSGAALRPDFHFLGRADFRGRLTVDSLLGKQRKFNFMWSFEPAGFLQMLFIDREEFDRTRYQFQYLGHKSLNQVRCYVFGVKPAPRAPGTLFVGTIWVEDQEMNILRIKGTYSPAFRFSPKTLEDEYYFHFDSIRTKVTSGI
jgi:hypothetical protein